MCLGFEEEEEDLDYIMLCYDTLVAIAWPAIAGAQFMYFKIIILWSTKRQLNANLLVLGRS